MLFNLFSDVLKKNLFLSQYYKIRKRLRSREFTGWMTSQWKVWHLMRKDFAGEATLIFFFFQAVLQSIFVDNKNHER